VKEDVNVNTSPVAQSFRIIYHVDLGGHGGGFSLFEQANRLEFRSKEEFALSQHMAEEREHVYHDKKNEV